MTRTAARLLAMQLSFADNAGSDFGADEFFNEEYFSSMPSEESLFAEQPDERQRAYITAVVNGVHEHRDELDAIVSRLSHGWKINRISRTALGVLRCALFEILYLEEIPAAASVNEAVELAKNFDEPETVSFINGILGSFLREREAEAK